MASGGEEEAEAEAAAVEWQLEQHLEEQRESLGAVDSALASDPANHDLLQVRRELLSAIKDAEEGLLELKRSRLVRQIDAIFSDQQSLATRTVAAEPLDPTVVEPEPLEAARYSVGSKCRFRHKDGRWYNGHVIGLEGSTNARISFLTPTAENMLMCKFFLEQRCRFGSNCRLSHGLVVPISSLKQYIPTVWQQSLVGSTVLATSMPSGIWRRAELESWDSDNGIGQVVFLDDGMSLKLCSDALSISEYAETSDGNDGEDTVDEDGSESSDEKDTDATGGDESIHKGIGFLEATKLQKGVQTDTVVFAQWEHHTRGIASKMMAGMGYREGMGLGISGQGIVNPLPVKVLPPKQSLDNALSSVKAEKSAGQVRKRSRGGKRKREKKYAEIARAARSVEEERSDVFSFINNQLAGQDAPDGPGSKARKEVPDAGRSSAKEDRKSLVAYHHEVSDLRTQVERLEGMVKRNRNDKTVREAASRKLAQTRQALADAEMAHTTASNAVLSKENEKKWLKF